jgi:hypothetical protein
MLIVPGDAKMECKLALRSLNRIIKATDPKVELRDVVQVLIIHLYTTNIYNIFLCYLGDLFCY